MDNEFYPKHYKESRPCTTKVLYNEKTLMGRLRRYFLIYFETFSAPTADYSIPVYTINTDLGIRTLHTVFVSAFFLK